MSGDTTENLFYIAAAVLLPLIPAYILYKTLPAAASVSGPLGKFTLKLSGAFAGYFALVIIIFGFVYSRPKPCPQCPAQEKPRYTVYKAYGQLKSDTDENLSIDTSLTLTPRSEILSNGTFTVDVPIDEQASGSIKNLEISRPGFKPETVPLAENPPISSNYSVKFDTDKRMIQIQEPIILKKVSKPYSGGKELTPVSDPQAQENKP